MHWLTWGAPKVPWKTHPEGGAPQKGTHGQEFECWPEALPLQVAVSTLVRRPLPG
jgi:hypothetical protein